MRAGALLFTAVCALALLPDRTARADVTSCREELQRLAQTYHLSVSPPGSSAAQPSPGGTAEAPTTTESRGMTAGPDSLASSGGTLPPATSSTAPEQRGGASPPQQLGAADRARVEGLISQGQAADGQGKGDQCLEALREAQGMLQKARQ